ncbi:MAG TPA: SPOR domain-containing protein [Gemmatimonadaceae bacterium]
MRRLRNHLLLAAGMLLPAIVSAAAQSPSSVADSVFRRARKLVSDGNGQAGRAVVDSILHASEDGSPAYGNALYWRGALAETAAEAERDYRTVIVEYPLSPYVDDALLAMADLESARGDRAGALQHLQRFVREHPVSSAARGTAALNAARLAFEQRDTRVGCTMIAAARESTPQTSVEARNQIDYLGGRCTAESSVAPSPPVAQSVSASKAPAPTKVKDSSAVASVAAPKPSVPVASADSTTRRPRGSYTIQLAAYNTKPEAERLVARLATQGVNARVSGTTKPFRVRLGFHASRQEAQDEVNKLRARGIIGFVATETPPPEGKVP